MDYDHYMSIFLDEGRETLQQVSDLLLTLEREPEDGELVHTLFRAMHSYKGMASTMGFEAITELAHAVENLLDALREGAIAVQPGLIDVVLRCVDALEAMVDRIEAGTASDDEPVRLLKAELAAWQVHTRRVPAAEAEAPVREPEPQAAEGPRKRYSIEIALDGSCLMKSVRALMITSSLEALGAVESIRPSVEELEWPGCEDRFWITLASAHAPEEIEAALVGTGDVESVTVSALEGGELAEAAMVVAGSGSSGAPWRVTVTLLAGSLMRGVRASMVLATLGELGTVLRTRPEAEALAAEAFGDRFEVVVSSTEPPDVLRERLMNIAEVDTVKIEPGRDADVEETPAVAIASRVPAADEPAPAYRPARPEEAQKRMPTVRVSVERLDALLDLVGTLLNDQARLVELTGATEDGVGAIARRLGETAGQVQDEVLRLRMVPVETLFARVPRMVRDLARELGKEVRLQLAGRDTELDRRIADEIGDTLVHLVRNALDHGLEPPAERLAAGKGEVGSLLVSAAQEGHEVLLTITDDGRGIDPEALVAKALEKGLLGRDEAARFSRDQAIELLFRPGFTTAECVTTVSGRGVGMDAVRSKVRALGGAIHVDSTPGQGTAFIIRLPMSMSVVPAMLTDVGGEVYGIPLNVVEAVIPLDTAVDGELTLTGGDIVPVVSLRERFDVPAPAAEAASLVVVRTATHRVGLMVEKLLGEQEVAVKPLSRLHGAVPFLQGAAPLGDGRVALMLDPEQI